MRGAQRQTVTKAENDVRPGTDELRNLVQPGAEETPFLGYRKRIRSGVRLLRKGGGGTERERASYIFIKNIRRNMTNEVYIIGSKVMLS